MSQYGCFLCGSHDYPVLTSRDGHALCPPCEVRFEKEGPAILKTKPKTQSTPTSG